MLILLLILSAYLVELLRFLQVSPCLPKPPAQYGPKDKQVPSSSLFERLLSRRPDDQKIELSHENDSVLVDYIDLANEVVKSFIFYLQEIPVHFSQFLDRAEVAEMLNLSQEDFLAITTESFWSSPIAGFLFGMSLASYVENQHLNIASFCGYKPSDYAGAKGILTVRRQGFRFFESHLSDLKRRLSVVSSADQPPRKLVTAVCEELHSTVRFRQKLGWEVSKLDKCISCLKRNAMKNGLPDAYRQGISPQLLIQLGVVKGLGEYLGGMDVEESLSL
ncbi:PA14 domain-containing protein [Fusarium phyllophilum]|uniref:PA14 domain-containing protein n=1 Tax=Fusarium phyllophilum TaxID=47803 RepID=A0A8H5IXV0_9HYPO|nr:PA14 domain-containing protein [Fusarium phyllophilum]